MVWKLDFHLFGPVSALPGPSSTLYWNVFTLQCQLFDSSLGLNVFFPLTLDNSQFIYRQIAAVAFDRIFPNQTWYDAFNTLTVFLHHFSCL